MLSKSVWTNVSTGSATLLSRAEEDLPLRIRRRDFQRRTRRVDGDDARVERVNSNGDGDHSATRTNVDDRQGLDPRPSTSTLEYEVAAWSRTNLSCGFCFWSRSPMGKRANKGSLELSRSNIRGQSRTG